MNSSSPLGLFYEKPCLFLLWILFDCAYFVCLNILWIFKFMSMYEGWQPEPFTVAIAIYYATYSSGILIGAFYGSNSLEVRNKTCSRLKFVLFHLFVVFPGALLDISNLVWLLSKGYWIFGYEEEESRPVVCMMVGNSLHRLFCTFFLMLLIGVFKSNYTTPEIISDNNWFGTLEL